MTTLAVPVRPPATRNIIESIIIAVVLTALSYYVGFEANWITTINWLEVFAVFTSYSCTYLCVVERRINYPIGATSTIAYAILFFQQNLNASALLNAYLTFQLIYGWFRWRSDAVARPVSFVGLKWWPAYAAATAGFYLGAVWIAGALGSGFVWTDAAILIGSILAQFLLDNKKLENWAVWFVVDVFAIYEYASAGLSLAAFQYVFFLANTIYGYYCWNKSRSKHKKFSEETLARVQRRSLESTT